MSVPWLVVGMVAGVAAARLPVPPAADTGAVGDLPLVEVNAARATAPPAGRTLAILVTGDGDWGPLDRGVAGTLADSGVGVVGLRVRAYLTSGRRTPDRMAGDVARVARTYLARWGDDRLVLIGYSRGADLMPFVASRLPADVRARVRAVAMLGLATHASFDFRWLDLVRDARHFGDLPVAPELPRMHAALGGARLLCVYGAEEKDSGCRAADPAICTRIERRGAHHFDYDYPALAREVLGALHGAAPSGA